MNYYDDNFGNWSDTNDTDTLDFYREVQKNSVTKVCRNCERIVHILPQYAICNSCADAAEKGMEY